ncbi:MAG: HlyD family efflux transporter periplasmic adaptor subunit [Candidatus Brocadiaceae bacterium]|jgi:multidrug resistance efflux pump
MEQAIRGPSREAAARLTAGAIFLALLTMGASAWADTGQPERTAGATIVLPGTLEASDAVLVTRRSQDWRNPEASLVELVPEGSRVEKGDVLFKVDTTGIERRVADQEATVKSSRLAVTAAESEVATLEAELEATRQSVPLQLAAARLKVERLRNLPEPAELAEAEAEVERLRATLQEAESQLEDVAALARRELASEQALVMARFDRHITAAELARAEAHLEHVEAGADARQIKMVEIGEQIAEIDLELATAGTEVNMARAQVDLQAARADLAFQEGRLGRLRKELTLATRHAPSSGKVVYCEVRVGYREYEKVSEGVEVDLADPVVSIISGEKFQFRAQADESLLARIRPGQAVEVRLEALPETPLAGTVERFDISRKGRKEVVAEALIDLESPRPKEFDVIIALEEVPEELMPGLSGTAELGCGDEPRPEAAGTPSVEVPRGSTPPVCFPGYVAAMEKEPLFTPINVMGYITRLAPPHTHLEEGDVILELTGTMARANLEEIQHLPELDRERVRLARKAAECEQQRCELQSRKAKLRLEISRLEVEHLESLPRPTEARMAEADVEKARLQLQRAERLKQMARLGSLDSEYDLEQKKLAAELARLTLEQEKCRLALRRKGAPPEELEAARYGLRDARLEAETVSRRAEKAHDYHEKLIAKARVQLNNRLGKLALLEQRLEGRILRAPVSGEIVYGPHRYHRHRTIKKGDFLPHWPLALGYMCDLSRLKLCAVVDQPYVARLRPNQSVRVRLRAFGNRLFEGRVIGIVPLLRDREQVTEEQREAPDRYSRVRSTRVDIALELPEDSPLRVLPGMTGTAFLPPEEDDGS